MVQSKTKQGIIVAKIISKDASLVVLFVSLVSLLDSLVGLFDSVANLYNSTVISKVGL